MSVRATALALPAAILLWSACAPEERAPDEALAPARAAASGLDLRPYVELAADGAVDWGNLRLVVRVVVPVMVPVVVPVAAPVVPPLEGGRVDQAVLDSARALAGRAAVTLAAGVRVDSRDTLSSVIPDSGALGRRTAGSLRPLGRRLLPTGELEETYEIPLTGEGGLVEHLYERASRTLAPPSRAPFAAPTDALATAGSSSQPGPVPAVARALPATAGGRWGIDWSLGSFKGLAGPSAGEADAPVILIDARGTGLEPALFPAILDENGEPVRSADSARRDFVVREGLVQYVELGPGADLASLARAPGLRRRVVVKAVAAEGPLCANVVLDADDARRVRAEAGALAEARVVILMEAGER